MPTVGSSRIRTAGSEISASAKRTRCACPPDSLCVRRSAISVRPTSSSASSSSSGSGYSDPIIASSSRGVTSRISAPDWSIAPTKPSATACCGDLPSSETVPLSGRSSPSSMSIVVDLPAPLGPSRATVSPAAIDSWIPRTACTTAPVARNDFPTPLSSTTAAGSVFELFRMPARCLSCAGIASVESPVGSPVRRLRARRGPRRRGLRGRRSRAWRTPCAGGSRSCAG